MFDERLKEIEELAKEMRSFDIDDISDEDKVDIEYFLDTSLIDLRVSRSVLRCYHYDE